MISIIIGILQLVNLISIVVLFTHLNPDDMTGIVQKMFNIYWAMLILKLILGIISSLGLITGDLEIGLMFLLKILQFVSVCVIIIKLYPNLKKISKNARISYIVMITTLSAYLSILIVTIINHI